MGGEGSLLVRFQSSCHGGFRQGSYHLRVGLLARAILVSLSGRVHRNILFLIRGWIVGMCGFLCSLLLILCSL